MPGGDGHTAALARTAIAVLGLVAAVLILAILGGSDAGRLSAKVIVTVVLFALFSLCALAGLFLAERRPHLSPFGLLTAILAAAAFLVVLQAYLSGGFEGRHLAKEILVIVTLAAGQASMLLAFQRDDDSPSVRAVLLGSLVALALFCTLAAVEISGPGRDVSYKLFAVVGVLYLLGALLPPLLRRAEVDRP